MGSWLYLKFIFSILQRQLFTTILCFGATKQLSTLLERRPASTLTRQSYRRTGTCPFPRSVSVWTSAWNRSGLLSINDRQAPCSNWSLTGNIAPPTWVVTCGRRWLVHKAPFSGTVTRKGSTLVVAISLTPKQESVSLVTANTTAVHVTPESGSGREGVMTTRTHVETRLETGQITATSTSSRWGIS